MADIIQNGITFTIDAETAGKAGAGKYTHSDNLDPNGAINTNKISKKGSVVSVNGIDIDWNSATLSHVNQPGVLDGTNQVNTTGQLLALINDLQNQINALAYIVTNGATSK